jgi:hypothetical protein
MWNFIWLPFCLPFILCFLNFMNNSDLCYAAPCKVWLFIRNRFMYLLTKTRKLANCMMLLDGFCRYWCLILAQSSMYGKASLWPQSRENRACHWLRNCGTKAMITANVSSILLGLC